MSAAPLKQELSEARKSALARAQNARKRAAKARRAELAVPEGFRSVPHFLDSVAERAGRSYGGQAELARYIGANTKSVSRWLKREKIPLQATIDAMARWYFASR